jgi:hypothetical protein
MQGVEAVDHILLGTTETTYRGQMNADPPELPAANGEHLPDH